MSEALLPHNATPQEVALDEATARVGAVPAPVRDVWSPQACPPDLLPWLAWAMSVDNWSPDWTVAQKRGAIARSAEVHRLKGTRAALNAAIEGLQFGPLITEWWEETPVGEPYTFAAQITVEQAPIETMEIYDSLVEVVNSAKNVRSHFDGIVITGRSRGDEWWGAVQVSGERIFIQAEPAA